MSESGTSEKDLIEVIAGVVPPLLAALDALGFVTRHLHPPQIDKLVDHVKGVETPVREGLAAFRACAWPADLDNFRERVEVAACAVTSAYEELAKVPDSPNGIIDAYRALRHAARANEALYPLSVLLPPIGRFFLEDGRPDVETRLAALTEGAGRPDTGIIHASNEKNERGGFSLYVPEDYDESRPWPLVVALHGGSGHGRDFLWQWLRQARSRGAILLSPTSRDGTWALMGPDPDTPNIEAMLKHVRSRWNIDTSRMLLTGMSDGATFSYVTGLRPGSPFTHLAPMSGTFHPMLIDGADPNRVNGLPVYVVHGALDWMFPAHVAQMAAETLKAAGAETQLDVIDDLSHTYASEANSRVMDWFLGSGAVQESA